MFFPNAIRILAVCFVLLVPVVWAQQLWPQSALPAVPVVTANQIKALVDTADDSVVIVDVRAQAETDVSMIPTAITREAFEQNIQQHRGKRVIVYCTIGRRSGVYAGQLRRDGWNALNYKGSILDWCDHGFSLVTRGQIPTQRVHTYDSRFSAPLGYVSVR
jgi:rhodanese-related sulfurtransferase